MSIMLIKSMLCDRNIYTIIFKNLLHKIESNLRTYKKIVNSFINTSTVSLVYKSSKNLLHIAYNISKTHKVNNLFF